MSRHLPQHGRKRQLRWKPWAKWVHLGAFTWSLLFVAIGSSRISADTFAGRVFLSLVWTVIYYIALVLVFGFLLTLAEKNSR